jgi:hypothetical protein
MLQHIHILGSEQLPRRIILATKRMAGENRECLDDSVLRTVRSQQRLKVFLFPDAIESWIRCKIIDVLVTCFKALVSHS